MKNETRNLYEGFPIPPIHDRDVSLIKDLDQSISRHTVGLDNPYLKHLLLTINDVLYECGRYSNGFKYFESTPRGSKLSIWSDSDLKDLVTEGKKYGYFDHYNNIYDHIYDYRLIRGKFLEAITYDAIMNGGDDLPFSILDAPNIKYEFANDKFREMMELHDTEDFHTVFGNFITKYNSDVSDFISKTENILTYGTYDEIKNFNIEKLILFIYLKQQDNKSISEMIYDYQAFIDVLNFVEDNYRELISMAFHSEKTKYNNRHKKSPNHDDKEFISICQQKFIKSNFSGYNPNPFSDYITKGIIYSVSRDFQILRNFIPISYVRNQIKEFNPKGSNRLNFNFDSDWNSNKWAIILRFEFIFGFFNKNNRRTYIFK